MKKIKVVAVSAMVLAMGSMVFANPKSNTKKATVDLFEDGVVDSLKTGVEDNKGFAAVGYGNKAFNVAAGAWLADTFWFGLAYDNNNRLLERYSKSTAYSYTTNGTTDIVDTTTTTSDKMGNPGFWAGTYTDNLNVKHTDGKWFGEFDDAEVDFTVDGIPVNTGILTNNVSVNLGIKGIGGEIYWNNLYAATKDNTSVVTEEQSSATKKVTSTTSTSANKNNNTWGINFAGLKTAESGDLAFYVRLDNAEFTLNSAGSEKTLNGKITKHGSEVGQTLGSGNNIDGTNETKTWTEESVSKSDYTAKQLGGKIGGALGFTLPEFGIVTPSFEFADSIYGYYTANSKKGNSKKVTTTYTTKTTEEKSTSTNYGADFNIGNLATPSMKFAFDAGENVKIAAKVKVPVSFTYFRNEANYNTSKTVTTTESLAYTTKTVTNVYTEDVTGISGDDLKDVNQYVVNVVPEVDLGIVWAVMPNKLNFNFGVAATAGNFTWNTKNKTASKKVLHSESTAIDEFDVKTVTNDSKSLKEDSNTDSSTCDYTVTSANVKGNIGATLFLGEYAALDMLVANSVDAYGLANFFQNWSFDIMFSAKF